MAADNPVQPDETPAQTEAEWWAEDAARHNAIGEYFRDNDQLIGTEAKPPKLKDDGSLAEE